jgi:hypothetical protein
MRRKNAVPGMAFLFITLAALGCSKAEFGGSESAAADFSVEWTARAGQGYAAASDLQPESPLGLEGQSPPAYMPDRAGRLKGAATAADPSQEMPGPEKSRKLIKSARIRIRVENLQEAAAAVEALLERRQAYASNSSMRDNFGNYTLKIPSVHYESVLREIENIGRVLHRSESVEDATLRYYDLDGRLNTRLELLKTFQSYLGKAANIDEIMTVEKRIAELQQEIDWYGSRMTELSHLIDYATVNLDLLGPASESPNYRPSLKDRIGELFQSFSGVAATALVVIVGIFIFGIPALLILILLFWILFGRIGLLRRIWCLVGTEKSETRRAKTARPV